MRLLLDTHVAIWFFADPERLGPESRDAIEDSENVAYLSAVSIWEWAIKHAQGHLTMPDRMDVGARRAGFEELPVTWAHGRVAASLPPLHRDPFDRMLVAQALEAGLLLVTRDRKITQYAVATMPA